VFVKLLETKLSCLGMLNTWYARLGLPEVKKLEVTEDFVKRIQQLLPKE
jgi:hypothetical protein